MSWKSTSFSEMGSGAPSQNIQPLGAKLPANILISPTYGAIVFSSLLLVLRREDALESDNEVQHQVGHHVVVRLAAADGSHRLGVHRLHPPVRPEIELAGGGRQKVRGRGLRRAVGRCAHKSVD